jgi:hypothetical protein
MIGLLNEMFRQRIRRRIGKRAIALDYLGWIIIAVVVLVLAVIAIVMIKGKQEEGFSFIKDLLRWS